VKNQTHRPLLHDPDPQKKIRDLLAAREPFYKQADVLLNTDMRSVREVAQQVVHQFRLEANEESPSLTFWHRPAR
jgi:shikimate kinase